MLKSSENPIVNWWYFPRDNYISLEILLLYTLDILVFGNALSFGVGRAKYFKGNIDMSEFLQNRILFKRL